MPMTAHQFELRARRWNVSPAAYELIKQTRNSAPARYVESVESGNTIWRYPSRKLGLTVSLESSEEHGYAVQREFDPSVLEYWDQPPRVTLLAKDARGHFRRVPYVADFLVLYEDRAQIVQIKTLEKCRELAARQPARWSVEGLSACDHVAKDYYAGMGLDHVVHVSGPGEKVRVENYSLLLRCSDSDLPLDDVKRVLRAIGRLDVNAVVSLQQLLDAAGVANASAALSLVKKGVLFTDIDRCRLALPAQCLVSPSASRIAEHFTATQAAASVGLDCRLMHSPEIITAYKRRQELEGHTAPTRSERTRRGWRQVLAQAGGAWTALAPRHASKGNRLPRLSAAEEELLRSAIKRYFLTQDSLTYTAAYGQYVLDHDARRKKGELPADSKPVHRTTFEGRCRALPGEIRERARAGRRAGNAHAAPVPHDYKHLTPARAMERVHIDHYLCDIHVLVGHTDKPETRRPWLTAMRDESTGAIFALSLSFRAPSHLSCLSVLRDCVRRHRRLPETIVVDNGVEFNSTYFETTLACMGVAKQSRPPGNPRFGGSIEGWFHSVKAFLVTQTGNTTNDSRARSASESHKGRRHTRWTILNLFKALEEFAFRYFNSATPAGSLSSRSDLVARSLATFPHSGHEIAFDERFMAMTAAPLKRKLTLDPARGVKHLERWFSHPKLFVGRNDGKKLQAFAEPWDQNRIYVRCNGELLTCRHGAHGNISLDIDFSRALESILFLECQDVRARQGEIKLRKGAQLARDWRATRDAPAANRRPATSHTEQIEWPDPGTISPYGRRAQS